MNELINKKNKYILELLIIIYSTDSFLTFANVDPTPKLVFKIILIFGVIFAFIKWNKKIYRDKESLFVFVAFLCIGATVFINSEFSFGHFTKIIVLMLGFLWVRFISFRLFREIYADLMVFIALFSVATFILMPILITCPYLPKISNGGSQVVCLGFSNLYLETSGDINRNWGFFWEPGAYQSYLVVALLFIWKEPRRPRSHTLIILLALLLTLSTTGYICVFLLAVGYLIDNEKRGKVRRKKIFLLLLGIAALLFIIGNDNVMTSVFGKFSPSDGHFESTRSRVHSISGNLYALKHNVIFGVGIAGLDKYFAEYMQNTGYEIYSNTNGLLMNFAVYGVIWGCTYTYALFKLASRINGKIGSRIIVFIVLLILLITEPFLQSAFFNIIIFYGLHREEKQQIIEGIN